MSAGEIRAFAPATVANVGCGFDVLGFALEAPGDTVVARRTDGRGVTLVDVRGDGGVLPRDERNTAFVAAAAVLQSAGVEHGVALTLEKGMPLASGLGSSAASAVAAVVAVDALLGSRLSFAERLRCALEGERAAVGTPHADNAGASLAGGFVLVRGSGQDTSLLSLPVPENLTCAMLHPHVEISTRDARQALPTSVALSDAVTQWGNVGALVTALHRSDHALLASALVDRVAEPARAPRVPGFIETCAAAREAGALGSGLSGSGPSIFALCDGRERAEEVARAMRAAFERGGHGAANAWVSPVGAPGARVIP